MNCEQFELLCTCYLDDELTDAERAGVEAHAAACPECADYLKDMRRIAQMMSADKTEMPENLHEDIMNLIMAESQMGAVHPFEAKRRRPPVFTMIAAACAVVVLGISGTIGDWVTSGRDMISAGGSGTAAPESAMAANEFGNDELFMQAGGTDDMVTGFSVGVPDEGGETQPKQYEVWNGTEADGSADVPSAEAAEPEGNEAAPRTYGAAAPNTRMEQFTAAFPAISVPTTVKNTSYAFCYVVRAQESELPAFEGRLIEEDDGTGVSYFTVKNSVSLLETLSADFAQKGLALIDYEDADTVTIDDAAEIGLLIVLAGD